MEPTQLPFIPVIIIGGGFSGLAMGAQLKRKLNFEDYILYERSPDLGAGCLLMAQYRCVLIDLFRWNLVGE